MARTQKNVFSKNPGISATSISYQTLMNQIELLQKRAQDVRRNEVISTVTNIKQQMKDHGLNFQDLKINVPGEKSPPSQKKIGRPVGSKNKDKAADAVAQSTSATGAKKIGRPVGSKNKSKAADAVAKPTSQVAEQSETERKRVFKNRRKPEAKFRNPTTGETWTGRGRTPKWMSGKKREQFAIVAH